VTYGPNRAWAEAANMAGVALDRSGLVILTRPECVELLKTASVGRIALSVGALPVVLPVNFGMLDDDIVLRTVPGSRLEAAARNAVVAFEVDRLEEPERDGWSVLVQGLASEIADPDEVDRARRVPLPPWLGAHGVYLRIASRFMSGRRLPSIRAGVLAHPCPWEPPARPVHEEDQAWSSSTDAAGYRSSREPSA
jgi:nitroimidazol reductase NimA-like FMN-containing flavoprotein (pyridoxamine 5'-phosphate oxidase superfamily)